MSLLIAIVITLPRLARSKGQRPTVRRVVLARCRCPIARRKVNRRRLRRVPLLWSP